MAAEVDKKEEAAPKKKGNGLVIGIVAVVLLAGVAGAYLVLSGSKGGEDSAKHAVETQAPEPAKGTIFALEPFIVNLQDNSGTRYLKLTVNLELPPGAMLNELSNQSTQIRDSLIILLSSKSYSDIGTVEGKYRMRDEIVARVNQYLTQSKVNTAYFTEFVIQ
ncbi:MAG: flagellar basal body-associated FliL family protein [Deltaproteobacteria bacterium]|nr:flagellar basal body-associated FliL family protein [Deltaproteobacteria bacterium]MBZ0219288.1 flagellar basal body-associated FliL family protein [Deltaproteobacteria bacterium]